MAYNRIKFGLKDLLFLYIVLKILFENLYLQINTLILNRHLIIFILILIIVPLGLFSKAYTGIGQSWVHDYSGDILYEILWCLVFFWFFPSKKATVTIPLWVFIVTSLIEVSQLFFDRVPVALRETIIWKLLLGSTFVWWDFLYYAIGCLLGWLLLDRIYIYSK